MINSLKEIVRKEKEALTSLLLLLEKQHKFIINKEVFELDAIVDEIKLANKSVAMQEVARRKLLNGKSLKEVVYESDDKELDRDYRDVKMILSNISLQNETNELLIKQQLSYTNRLLSIINPQRNVKTYNACGRL